MPQCRQMKTCVPSRPRSLAPKKPPTCGISGKSNFCNRTQAGRDRGNTASFPGFLGFLTAASRLPTILGDISHHQHALRHTGIRATRLGQPGRNIKLRNEVNLTQDKSEARRARRSQGNCTCFIRVHPPDWPLMASSTLYPCLNCILSILLDQRLAKR